MALPRLLQELRRRRVFRVAAVYAVAGWVVIQVAATVQPFLALPPAFVTGVILLVGLAFPVALGLAWAFDVTPEGVRRTRPADVPDGAETVGDVAPARHRRWLAAGLLLALVVVATVGLTALRQRGRAARAQGPTSAALSPSDASPPAAGAASIAVLPFQNLSAEKSNEYLSDGITDEILTNLARVAGVQVISHTSVMQYRNTVKPIRQIARELGVATVLEGSVQQAGGRVRIEAQLIDARGDRHLWADKYDRELKDVFAVESDVAEKIVQALQARLTPAEHERMVAQPTASPDAHRLYLQGRAFWYRETQADLEHAGQLFQQATEIDPSYALAYSGLSDVYFDLARYRDRPANMARARAFAQRALALDSTLAEPHDALGVIAAYVDRDAPRADSELRRSIALKPGYTPAHYDLATVLAWRRRYDEALAEARTAARLDPLAFWAALAPAEVLIPARRCDEALALTREALGVLPESFRTHDMLGQVYRCLGRLPQAAAEFRRAIQLSPAPGESANDRIYFALTELPLGKRAQAERTYAEVAGTEDGSKVVKAQLAAQLGRTGDALRLLEGAYQDGAFGLFFLEQNPDFAALRNDPRFQALARRGAVR